MKSRISLLLALLTIVTSSFLQTPANQFHLTFNSTFLKENEKLFKPIIIPNMTDSSETSTTPKTKLQDALTTKSNEILLKNILQPKESTIRENFSSEESKIGKNSLKFSSRYSTKPEIREQEKTDRSEGEILKKNVENTSGTTQIPEKNEKHKFSERSDDLGDSEEEDTFRYNEPGEAEPLEIASTTNEPYPELRASFRSSPYPDNDSENYETTSTSSEETNSSEENEEEEEKRSVKDHYNSGSKNYHSIQTPLDQVKYLGPNSYKGSFVSEKPRTRLISPITRHHVKHNWPYTRTLKKPEFDETNEISDSEETYEKNLDEEVKKEVRTNPKQLNLELAIEKDEFKFEKNRKYNPIEEKNRRKQQQKNLIAAEEKDGNSSLYPNLKQYQVKEPSTKGNVISEFKTDNMWTSAPTATTPKNIFKPNRKPKEFDISTEHNFQGLQFLGPVVFNHNLEQQRTKPLTKPRLPIRKPPSGSPLLKGLSESEKLDQDHLTNQRIQKSKFASMVQQSFNHLQESDDMYSAILANIQSVFGVRSQPLDEGGRKLSALDINLDESKSFTWSLPWINHKRPSSQ